MSGAIHPSHQYAFMAWCSVKAQGQLLPFIAYAKYQIVKCELLSLLGVKNLCILLEEGVLKMYMEGHI
jgi:hypothetical protein